MTGVLTLGPAGVGAQGWGPGEYDKNDRYYVASSNIDISKSSKVDLRRDTVLSKLPVYDQGDIGSCVANASSMAFWYELHKAGLATIDPDGPARYFLYWMALKGDTVDNFRKGALSDDGTYNRHAMKLLHKRGVCHETLFPYVQTRMQLNIATEAEYKKWFLEKLTHEPQPQCYDDGTQHKIGAYYRLDADRYLDQDIPDITPQEKDAVGVILLDNLKRCLQDQHPVVFAFRYYWSEVPWETQDDEGIWHVPDIWNGPNPAAPYGRHTYPDPPPGKVWGGHAVLAIGYDDTKKAVLVQNSWGINVDSWRSKGGLFYMPYTWITDFAATNDFWTCRLDDKAPFLTAEQINQKVREKAGLK